MKTFIVWNADKSEGFVTTDEQLAYEVRKSADTNCFTHDGQVSPVAIAFCNRWCMDECTLEVL